MKKFLVLALLSISSIAMAQDIPHSFLGIWVTSTVKNQKLTATQVKNFCSPRSENDEAIKLVLSDKKMQLYYWEASEDINNFKFIKMKPNYLLGTAKLLQRGFVEDEEGKASDKEVVFTRKIEFALKDGELIELYRDDHNATGKSIWYKRYWKKC